MNSNAVKNETTTINASDELYWAGIRNQYTLPNDFINLENGYFSVQSRPVFEAFERYNAMVNRQGAHFLRTQYPARIDAVLDALATFTGARTEELVITRNLVEAMNILIQGYPFAAGDEVIHSSQDYDAVVATLQMTAQRKNLKLTAVRLPLHPQSDDEIVAAYEEAITPQTRVILVTHMIHMTGHLVPVAKIARMARARGVDVLVDAAHSFAQIDYRLPELDSEFVAVNLHKWLGAPLGVGLLYIKKKRIAEIAPLYGVKQYTATDIRKFTQIGTTPPAPILAIPDAIAFHHLVGGRNKEARLRYLKDYWMTRVCALPGIESLTPASAERSCAIGAFRVAGVDAQQVTSYLFDQHHIFTVARDIDGAPGVRVTPHLYTTTAELDQLIGALTTLTQN